MLFVFLIICLFYEIFCQLFNILYFIFIYKVKFNLFYLLFHGLPLNYFLTAIANPRFLKSECR